MAVSQGQEIELLDGGTAVNTAAKGRFVQNMFWRKNALEVRPGFGQIGQFDTTQSMPPAGMYYPQQGSFGYQEVLATAAIQLASGNVQIATLLTSSAYTGSSSVQGKWQQLFVLSVFDVTTRTRWEEVLHRHTSEYASNGDQMPLWRACFETYRDADFSAWPWSTAALGRDDVPEVANDYRSWFCQLGPYLLFGSPHLGVWCYSPTEFTGARPQQVDGICGKNYSSVYGESSKVFRVTGSNGLFSDEYAYLDSAVFPAPVDAVQVQGRVAFASGREVYFTDIGNPRSIIGTNILNVPSETDITMLAEQNGNLLICTGGGESFVYQLSGGAIAADGVLQRISSGTGAFGAQSKCKTEDGVVWADRQGVYFWQGLFDFKPIADDLWPLFNEQMSNPLLNFYTNDGNVLDAANAPKSFFDLGDARGLSMAYDKLNDIVLLSIPALGIACALQSGKWSVWNFESIVNDPEFHGGPAEFPVAVHQPGIRNVRLCAAAYRLFVVGGVDAYTPNDATTVNGAPHPENSAERSYYVLEWGHGGAMDRSVDATEDNRGGAGYYQNVTVGGTSPLDDELVVFDRPVLLPDGYRGWRDHQPKQYDFPKYLFPVWISCTELKKINIAFKFDNTKWTPVLVGNTAELDFILPTERLYTKDGWGWGAPAINKQIRCYNSGTLAPDPAGDLIVMEFDASAAPMPYMRLKTNYQNPLVSLAFERKFGTLGDDCMSLGVSMQAINVVFRDNSSRNLGGWFWHAPYLANLHAQDDAQQSVDWCFKSAQIGELGPFQLRARTLFLKLISHGMADPGAFPMWPRRLLNSVMSSDWTEVTSQIADFQRELNLVGSKDPLRARFRDSLAILMSKRVFNSQDDNPPVWGSAGTETGNFLVDEEQLDTIAISSSARGEHLSVMLFGHILDKAERLVLQSAKQTVTQIAGRRRWGR